MERPHFLNTGNGVFLILRRNKRARYPAGTKLRAVEMIRVGYGRDAIAVELDATGSVRKWRRSCWAAGYVRSFAMGAEQGGYAFELEHEAARAVVDGVVTLPEAMSRFEVAAESTLESSARPTGGERPQPFARSRRAVQGEQRPKTRERELEERCRRLEAEVAYLNFGVKELIV